MSHSHYNDLMNYRDINFRKDPDIHSGEDIHKVINNVHLDYEDARKSRRDVELTIYYRDLLSFLIKNYGH